LGSGEERLNILPETLLYSVYGREDGAEQYYCNYGVNEDYEARLQAAGLRVSARGTHGEPRAVELVHHRFFLATLFQPQLSSRPDAPHPIWLAFLRAQDGRQVTDGIAIVGPQLTADECPPGL